MQESTYSLVKLLRFVNNINREKHIIISPSLNVCYNWVPCVIDVYYCIWFLYKSCLVKKRQQTSLLTQKQEEVKLNLFKKNRPSASWTRALKVP